MFLGGFVSVLMSLCNFLVAACFLEHWKRRQMCLKHSWDLTSLEDEEVLKTLLGERGGGGAHVKQ